MMLYYIVKEGLADQVFIEDRTEGYEDFCDELLKLDIAEMESVAESIEKLFERRPSPMRLLIEP